LLRQRIHQGNMAVGALGEAGTVLCVALWTEHGWALTSSNGWHTLLR